MIGEALLVESAPPGFVTAPVLESLPVVLGVCPARSRCGVCDAHTRGHVEYETPAPPLLRRSKYLWRQQSSQPRQCGRSLGSRRFRRRWRFHCYRPSTRWLIPFCAGRTCSTGTGGTGGDCGGDQDPSACVIVRWLIAASVLTDLTTKSAKKQKEVVCMRMAHCGCLRMAHCGCLRMAHCGWPTAVVNGWPTAVVVRGWPSDAVVRGWPEDAVVHGWPRFPKRVVYGWPVVVCVRMARGRLPQGGLRYAVPVGRRGKLDWIRVFARWPGFDPFGRLRDPGHSVVLRA